jgi:hypothetical protein
MCREEDAVTVELHQALRESGFATVRVEGARRVYAEDARPLAEVDGWLNQCRRFWSPALEALATEIARGKRARDAMVREIGSIPRDRRGRPHPSTS